MKPWSNFSSCARFLMSGAILCATAPMTLQAQSLSITGTISNTVGTTAVIPVGQSGTADNTTNWALGTVGVFEINNGDYYMRVNATNPTGGVSPAGDSLMVVRTVGSQGLTDTGTLSVYVRPTPAANTPWTLDLNFSFFSDSSLTAAAPVDLLLTSLDIDFNQLYYVSNSTFSSNNLATGTNITTPAIVPSGYNGFTAAGNSEFNNPLHAVASRGLGSSFDIRIGHNAVALFMFEFRNPSIITGLIPEPSSTLLGAFGAFALLRRRRAA